MYSSPVRGDAKYMYSLRKEGGKNPTLNIEDIEEKVVVFYLLFLRFLGFYSVAYNSFFVVTCQIKIYVLFTKVINYNHV